MFQGGTVHMHVILPGLHDVNYDMSDTKTDLVYIN